MHSKKFALIDAQSLIYQSYYALENMSTSTGIPTGAVFGFYQMLKKILSLYNPDYLLIAFDKGRKTFRHDMYDDYKKNRPSTPELLISQIHRVKELLQAMNISYLEKENYEADDIIATAVHAYQEQFEGIVYIISSDKDLYQLLNEKVRVVKHIRGNFLEIDQNAFKQKYGINPSQVPDYLALVGDTSDNIPGVQGIGPKTAEILLRRHPDLKSLFANLQKLEKEKWKKNLKDSKEQAFKSLQLAYLDTKVPVNLGPITSWELGRAALSSPGVQKIFRELEFFSLLTEEKKEPRELKVEWQWQTADKFISEKDLSVIYDKSLNGLGFFDGKKCYFFTWNECRKLKLNHKSLLYAHSVKDLFHLSTDKVPSITECSFQDLKIYEHLLASHINRLELMDLWKKYLNGISYPQIQDKKEAPLLIEQPDMNALARKAAGLYQIGTVVHSEIRKNELQGYYTSFEGPLIAVLYRMEKKGIAVDVKNMRSLVKDLSQSITQLEKEIYELAGEEFNIQSPRQLQEILFEKLGYKSEKKTKTGKSTNSEVLETLSTEYPQNRIPGKILEYRSYTKLLNTYLHPFLKLAEKNRGRISTRFEQTATATGRLSSNEPNLQNIPVRGEWGDKMRRVFIAREGYQLLSADYSQIELRVIAHFSEDRRMTEAFQNGEDIHTLTASNIFHCTINEVTPEKRRIAKAVNFGLIYGKTSFGLAKELKISLHEAREFIQRYFLDFSDVKGFIDQLYQQALKDGFVKTLHGRKRYIPELKARNKSLVEAGKRQAINTVIQGTAAEIIKLAMIKIDRKIISRNLRSAMSLQIHDELLFEVLPGENEEMDTIVKTEMENAVSLNVPLRCSLNRGKSWCK